MKILQVLPELNSGGVERGTLELARYLVAQGHESLVLSNGGRLVSQLESEGSTHLTLPVHRKSPSSLLQIPAIKSLLLAHQPDILHLRSRVPGWLCSLAWKQLPRTQRPHYLTTVHGLHSVSPYSRIVTKGERVICVSEAVKDYVVTNYPKTAPDKLVVIHRGIEPSDYPPNYQPNSDWVRQWQDEFPETQGKTLLTLPGRVTRLKGHEDFFEILRQLPSHCHGIVAGGAHEKKAAYLDELKAKANQYGLQNRITFTGQRSDLRNILAHSQLAFSLSQTPESFGRTTLEALALGTPVVGYDHGGVGEILRTCFPNGATPFKDTSQAATLSTSLLKEQPPIDAPGPFLLNNMLSQTLALYQELLNSRA